MDRNKIDNINDNDYEYTIVLGSDYLQEHREFLEKEAMSQARESADPKDYQGTGRPAPKHMADPSGSYAARGEADHPAAGNGADRTGARNAGVSGGAGYSGMNNSGMSNAGSSAGTGSSPIGMHDAESYSASAQNSGSDAANRKDLIKDYSPEECRAAMDIVYSEYEKMSMADPTVLDKDDIYPHTYHWRAGGRYDPDKIEVLEAALRQGVRIADTAAYERYVEKVRNRKFDPGSWD